MAGFINTKMQLQQPGLGYQIPGLNKPATNPGFTPGGIMPNLGTKRPLGADDAKYIIPGMKDITQKTMDITQQQIDKMPNTDLPTAPTNQQSTNMGTDQFGSGKGSTLFGNLAAQYGRMQAETERNNAAMRNAGVREAVQRVGNSGFSLAGEQAQRATDAAAATANQGALQSRSNLAELESGLIQQQKADQNALVQGAVSEKQKQFLAGVLAQGGDVQEAIKATQNPDGTIKKEFQDPTAFEVGIQTKADELLAAGLAQTPEEAYSMASEQSRAKIESEQEAVRQQRAQQESKTLIDQAIKSGNTEVIMDTLPNMTAEQKQATANALRDQAKKIKVNPQSAYDDIGGYEGMPIEANGKVYIITRRDYSQGGMGFDRQRLWGINPQTGLEEQIWTRKV